MDTVLTHLRTLITEYEHQQQKFALLWMAIQSGAPAGEMLLRVFTESAPAGMEVPSEPLPDEAASALVFSMGASAENTLTQLRFLEVLATSGGDE